MSIMPKTREKEVWPNPRTPLLVSLAPGLFLGWSLGKSISHGNNNNKK